MSVFGARLRQLRDGRGWSQRLLASKLKVSPSTVALYETGQRNPDPDMLKRIADLFNTPLDYLLGRTDEPLPETPKDDLATSARRLTAIRKSREMSQRELADRLGITVPELGRYESAVNKLPDSLIDKLVDVFEVDRRYFTGEIDQAEIEKLLGETWFRAPAKLSPEARKSVEDFIAFVIAQEERKKQQEKRQGQ